MEYVCNLLVRVLCFDEVAFRRLQKYPLGVVVVLWLSVALPISDTVTDWMVTAELLSSPHSYDQDFGHISLALILTANSITAMFTLWWDIRFPAYARFSLGLAPGPGIAVCNALPGFFLSLTNLRLPVTALVDSWTILTAEHGADPDAVKAPNHQAIEKVLVGATGIALLKVPLSFLPVAPSTPTPAALSRGRCLNYSH